MTRNRITKRRAAARRRPDVDTLGPMVRRQRGVCRQCHCVRDLVRGQGLCLFCFMILSRAGRGSI